MIYELGGKRFVIVTTNAISCSVKEVNLNPVAVLSVQSTSPMYTSITRSVHRIFQIHLFRLRVLTNEPLYSPLGKVNNGNSAGSKAGWGDVNPATSGVSDLWGMPNKSRGPPPGLTASKSSSQLVANSNGWGSLGSPRWPSMANSQSPWMGGSPWLLLRNLTPQVIILSDISGVETSTGSNWT